MSILNEFSVYDDDGLSALQLMEELAKGVKEEIDPILIEESARKLQEGSRRLQESARQLQEISRKENETEREMQEEARQLQEVNRVTSEETRSQFYNGFSAQLAEKANKVQEAFESLSVINGATMPYAQDVIQVRKNQFGEVELRGRVGVATNVDFSVLPLKYRPIKTVYFLCHAANNTVAYARILQTGEIRFLSGGNTLWVSLDNVKFTAGV